jgi:hypothetical protein
MNEFEVAVGADEGREDVFSPASEARLCDHLLGDARHGLEQPES